MKTSTKIIIEEAEKSGLDMTAYREGYDAKQLLEIIDALHNNFDMSRVSDPKLSYKEMREIKKSILAESRDEGEVLPSLSEVEELGLSSSYTDIDMIGLEYSMVGDICKIKLGGSYQVYSVIEFSEAYYFYKAGLISLVKYK